MEHRGALAEMFDSGSAAGTIALEPLLARPHLYALGPLADLSGELVVWDGTPFQSRVADGRVVLTNERDVEVPLLVWSRVARWKESAVPDDARSLAAFEVWLPAAAREAGLDASEPFAFLLIGAAEEATVHVVALPAGTPLTRESRDATKKTIELSATPIEALGFFSNDAKGVFSHHDSNVHVHLRTTRGDVMGHVDALTLAPGARLRLAWR